MYIEIHVPPLKCSTSQFLTRSIPILRIFRIISATVPTGYGLLLLEEPSNNGILLADAHAPGKMTFHYLSHRRQQHIYFLRSTLGVSRGYNLCTLQQ